MSLMGMTVTAMIAYYSWKEWEYIARRRWAEIMRQQEVIANLARVPGEAR